MVEKELDRFSCGAGPGSVNDKVLTGRGLPREGGNSSDEYIVEELLRTGLVGIDFIVGSVRQGNRTKEGISGIVTVV